MARPVRFAFAQDAQSQVIHVRDANKLHAYTCRECGKPVVFCDGERNQSYFRHKTREWAPEEHCEYGDETYAHRQAKAILQQQKWVRVPAVLPRRTEGYVSKLVPLRDPQVIKATHVYVERTLYEDAACGLNFFRQQRPFINEPGRRDFVCKPDVLFTDAYDRPVLLIEIHVTHAVDFTKLVGLRRAQIDTIEITIPWHYKAQQIAELLNSVQQTKWLYNHERETSPPFGTITLPTPPLRGDSDDEIPPLGAEPIECQLHEIREAVRSLKKFMAGPKMGKATADFEAARRALTAAARRETQELAAALSRAEEGLRQEFATTEAALDAGAATLGADQTSVARLFDREQADTSRKSAALDLDLAAAYRASTGGLRKRVDERRAAYRATEYAIATSRAALSSRLAAAQTKLSSRFRQAKSDLERATAASTPELSAATASEYAHQDRLAILSRYLESRCSRTGEALQHEIGRLEKGQPEWQRLRANTRHLEQQTATLERMENELRAEETAIRSQEMELTTQNMARAADEINERTRGDALRAAYQRTTAAIEAEYRAVEMRVARVSTLRRQLVGIKEAALDRRLTR